MLISSDNPDLPTDIIELKSQERSSFKRQNPVLVWNCLVTYQDCSILIYSLLTKSFSGCQSPHTRTENHNNKVF